jgi:hypothetical protein
VPKLVTGVTSALSTSSRLGLGERIDGVVRKVRPSIERLRLAFGELALGLKAERL